MRLLRTGMTLAAAAIVAVTASAASAGPAFTGNVCQLVRANVVASAGVTDPCVLQKPHHRRLYRVVYGASWGRFVTPPRHGLYVIVREPRSRQVLAHDRSVIKAALSTPGLHAMRNGYFQVLPNAVKPAQGIATFVAHGYLCEVYFYDNPASKSQIQTALLAIANDVANKV